MLGGWRYILYTRYGNRRVSLDCFVSSPDCAHADLSSFSLPKNNNNNNNKFVDGDKPTPKKKEKNQLRVFWGVGGQIMPISSSHYLT
jgi:hypothetical protein